jgi:hypothetical protein
MRAINILDLEGLATQLDSDGLEGHDEDLRALAIRARRAGISASLVDLVVSPGAPEMARLRAFGKIAALLADARPERPRGELAPAC